MNAVAYFDDAVLFGTSVLPATNTRLQFAVAARHRDNSEAESLLWEARAEDPTCLPVYFALYKFYANSKKLDRAERAARLALAESARQAGMLADWEKLSVEPRRDRLYGSGAGLFYLFSLKALAFIKLRRLSNSHFGPEARGTASFRHGCRNPASMDGNLGGVRGFNRACARRLVTVLGLDSGIPCRKDGASSQNENCWRRLHLQEAGAILGHLARLDPEDRCGGSVVRGLAESVGVEIRELAYESR
jgi:hypothetical protein